MRNSPHGHRVCCGFGVNVHVSNAQTRKIRNLAIGLPLGLELGFGNVLYFGVF